MFKEIGYDVYTCEPNKEETEIGIDQGFIDRDKHYNFKVQDIPHIENEDQKFDIVTIVLPDSNLMCDENRDSIFKWISKNIKKDGEVKIFTPIFTCLNPKMSHERMDQINETFEKYFSKINFYHFGCCRSFNSELTEINLSEPINKDLNMYFTYNIYSNEEDLIKYNNDLIERQKKKIEKKNEAIEKKKQNSGKPPRQL